MNSPLCLVLQWRQSGMASQITGVTIVYSTVCSGADQRNIKAPRHWPLWGEFAVDGLRWYLYKGNFTRNAHKNTIMFHDFPVQYIPRNMHTVFALLCFVVVIHWLIFPYPSGLLHWHCGNLTIAPVPAKQPWWIWINNSCEFIMNDCITTTKQSTTKPCAYFLRYTVHGSHGDGSCCSFRRT